MRVIALTALLFAAGSGVGHAAPDPLLWWPLNDGAGATAAEISLGLPSTLSSNNNSAGPTWFDDGAPIDCNRAGLRFDGIDDFVLVPDPGTPPLDGFGELTLSGWVKSSGQSADSGVIVSKYDTHNAWVSWSMAVLQSGAVRMLIGGSGGANASNEVYRAVDTGAGVVPVGVWTHVAGVWLGGSSFVIYVNGAPVATTSLSNGNFLGMYDGNVPIEIGSIHSAAGGFVGRTAFFRGDLDDVRVWNQALSPADIAELALGGASVDACDACPIACDPVAEQLFYGVVRRGSDGSLGSVQCWTTSTGIECRRALDGTLLIGPPECSL